MNGADYQERGLASAPTLRTRLDVGTVWSGAGVAIVDTRWQRMTHPARSAGCTRYAAIELMRTGSYVKRLGRRRAVADSTLAVFFNPSEAFEIAHPVGLENSGMTIRIDPAALDVISGRTGFRQPWARAPAGLLLTLHRFLARVSAATPPDALENDEAAIDLLDRELALDEGAANVETPSVAAQRCASQVLGLLHESLRTRPRLADCAAAAGCSVWHVARQFRRATGTSIHRTLTHLRLRHALENLRRGALDLTQLALDLGFSSHSHFSAAFRSAFGVTPSRFRRDLGGARRIGASLRSTTR